MGIAYAMGKVIEVVFKKDVKNLGHFGEVRRVRAGFARNFLIPKGYVLPLSDPRSREIIRQAQARLHGTEPTSETQSFAPKDQSTSKLDN